MGDQVVLKVSPAKSVAGLVCRESIVRYIGPFDTIARVGIFAN